MSNSRSRRQRGKEQLLEDLKAELHIHAIRLRQPDGTIPTDDNAQQEISSNTHAPERYVKMCQPFFMST